MLGVPRWCLQGSWQLHGSCEGLRQSRAMWSIGRLLPVSVRRSSVVPLLSITNYLSCSVYSVFVLLLLLLLLPVLQKYWL